MRAPKSFDSTLSPHQLETYVPLMSIDVSCCAQQTGILVVEALLIIHLFYLGSELIDIRKSLRLRTCLVRYLVPVQLSLSSWFLPSWSVTTVVYEPANHHRKAACTQHLPSLSTRPLDPSSTNHHCPPPLQTSPKCAPNVQSAIAKLCPNTHSRPSRSANPIRSSLTRPSSAPATRSTCHYRNSWRIRCMGSAGCLSRGAVLRRLWATGNGSRRRQVMWVKEGK